MEYIMPLWPAYPELFLLVMACVILVVDLFVSDDNRIVTYGLTQFTHEARMAKEVAEHKARMAEIKSSLFLSLIENIDYLVQYLESCVKMPCGFYT